MNFAPSPASAKTKSPPYLDKPYGKQEILFLRKEDMIDI
jgi:hypothetical protein